MSNPVTREELIAHLDPLRADVREVVDLLREQNSRISKSETKIAILEDRQPPARTAAVWGSGAGAFVGIVALLIDYVVKTLKH